MKIAIIGAGWLGCHVAYKLKKDLHNVTIFDKTDIFAGSSFFNQNRLHRGFHYSRNQRTRKLCYETFNLFISDYHELIDDIEHNFYVIPKDTSLIDFGTFESIFRYEQVPFTESELACLKNIDSSVIVNEKYIDPIKSKDFFKNHLSENFNKKEITDNDIKHLASEYDYVINTTNNILLPMPECYFELSLTLIYDRWAVIFYLSIFRI
jgi:protoporphyrinogen oxidase